MKKANNRKPYQTTRAERETRRSLYCLIPDIQFMVLGLLSDIDWIIHLVAGIIYFCGNGFDHTLGYIALIALAAVIFGVAYIIYLNKMLERKLPQDFKRI